MSSVVIELQREALDNGIPISALLRKALVVAKKLRISEFEKWILLELNGYSSKDKIPKYRSMVGSLKGRHPSRGWIPVALPDLAMEAMITRRECNQSIAEIESLLEKKDDSSDIVMAFPGEIQSQLSKATGWTMEYYLVGQQSDLVRIIDAVRTIILSWSLKLEEDGILGDGLAFTRQEKEKAERASYNITNFYAPVQGSQIQQQTSNSSQVMTVQELDLFAIQAFLTSLESQKEELRLSRESQQELDSEIATIQAQVKSPKPKQGIIREGLSSIRRILEGAGGGMAAKLLMEYGPLLMSYI